MSTFSSFFRRVNKRDLLTASAGGVIMVSGTLITFAMIFKHFPFIDDLWLSLSVNRARDKEFNNKLRMPAPADDDVYK